MPEQRCPVTVTAQQQRRFVPCRGDFLSENQLLDGLVAMLLSAPPAIWFKARRKVIGFPRKRRKSDSQENGELNDCGPDGRLSAGAGPAGDAGKLAQAAVLRLGVSQRPPADPDRQHRGLGA